MPHLIQAYEEKQENFDGINSINIKRKSRFAENSPFSWWLDEGQTKLPPEVERDNVEYKVNTFDSC